MPLEPGQHVVVERGLLGGLDLRQVEHDRRAVGEQALVVVHDVEHHVDDRGREARAVGEADVAVVEVQPAGAEDLGREVELLAPVVDDRPAEESPRPSVHLGGDLLGDLEEHGVRSMASLRLRWLSSDIVSTWPSASSPSNIQPSAPESRA